MPLRSMRRPPKASRSGESWLPLMMKTRRLRAASCTGREYERHTLVWYVIGHWRNYGSGKRVFIQPYWKGALRNLKMSLDGRDREIVR